MSKIRIESIAEQNELDFYELRRVIYRNDIKVSGFNDNMVDSSEVPRIIELYHLSLEEARKQEETAAAEEEAAKKAAEEEKYNNQVKQEALTKILISSGFSFDGYRIIKYSGYISGDDAVQIPRSGVFGGNNGKNLTDALVQIRRQALKELKEAAYDLGCNAVIGVDFDYITLDPETATLTGGTLYEPYVICVTANGNAVVIEKE